MVRRCVSICRSKMVNWAQIKTMEMSIEMLIYMHAILGGIGLLAGFVSAFAQKGKLIL